MCPFINVEYKNNNPIEVHQSSGNPDGTTDDKWKEYIPIWQDTTKNYKKTCRTRLCLDRQLHLKTGMMTSGPISLPERRLGYYVR